MAFSVDSVRAAISVKAAEGEVLCFRGVGLLSSSRPQTSDRGESGANLDRLIIRECDAIQYLVAFQQPDRRLICVPTDLS